MKSGLRGHHRHRYDGIVFRRVHGTGLLMPSRIGRNSFADSQQVEYFAGMQPHVVVHLIVTSQLVVLGRRSQVVFGRERSAVLVNAALVGIRAVVLV